MKDKEEMPKPSKMVAARRQKIVDALLETLTSPNSPIAAEDIYHFEFAAGAYGTAKVLDSHLQELCHYPDVQKELAVAAVVHALNWLMRSTEPVPAPPEPIKPPKPEEPVKSPPVEHHVWRCDRRE